MFLFKKWSFQKIFMNFKKMFLSFFVCIFFERVHNFKKPVRDLKNCSCFLEYSGTSYIQIPSIERIERKSRLNNSWAFSGIRWRNKTLKCPWSMNGKIADSFTCDETEKLNVTFSCAHKLLLAHVILTNFFMYYLSPVATHGHMCY